MNPTTVARARRWYESDVARELMAGTIGGCAGILVSQPFDVIKVRLQAGSAVRIVDPALTATLPESGARIVVPTQGIVKNLMEGWRREGVVSLYRGIGPPLLANGAINAVLFSTFEAPIHAVDGDVVVMCSVIPRNICSVPQSQVFWISLCISVD